jgi:D-alanyl-D-alanine carboxypeptidase
MHRLIALMASCLLAACSAPSQSLSPAPSLTPAPTPAATPSPTAEPQAQLAALLHAELQRNGAPGMLALVRQGGDVIFASAGTSDTAGAPIDLTTRFRIASITKPIVGALVLLAVRDGLLGLDDEVGDLLPGVLRDEPQVTVRQLLDHTSGVFDEGNDGNPLVDVDNIADPQLRAEGQALRRDYEAGREVMVSDRILIALAETHDRYNEPGMAYHYSNIGYQVLGMILEQVTGESLADLLRTEIVEPLGLMRTTLAPADRSTPDMHGYQPGINNEPMDVSNELSWFGNGANGGVISTADELLTIMDAMVSGRLLGPDLTATMQEAHLAQYGLGIGTYTLSCGTFYGHEGNVAGTRSIAVVSAQTGDGVIVALNVNSNVDPRLPTLADTLVCLPR